jgi:hypothetical protein
MHEPAIEEWLGGPAPADELEALSRGAGEEFPQIEGTVRRRGVEATVRALDKITARYTDITAKIGEPAKFGSLEILPRACDKRPPEDFPETTAFLEVFDRDLARARAAASVEVRGIDEKPERPDDRAVARPASLPAPASEASGAPFPQLTDVLGEKKPVDPDRIFAGWMFASSPALNALEHPVYDVWVIDCRTVVVDG